jgi:hypothetical protein
MQFRAAQITSVSVAFGVALSAAHASDLNDNPSLTKEWVIEAGAVFQDRNGSATSEGGGQGGSVSFSQTGLDRSDTSPYLALRWRFADAWRFDFSFASINAGDSTGNNANFQFGHSTFPVGYEISADYDQQSYNAGIGYSFVKTPQAELGGRISVGILDADFSLKGSAWVNNAKVTAGPENAGGVWVIPTVGLYATYALTNQWTIDGSVDGMAFNYEGYEGSYIAATANITYWFTESIAIAAGYRYTDSNLKHDGSTWDEEIEVRNSGPVVKTSIAF